MKISTKIFLISFIATSLLISTGVGAFLIFSHNLIETMIVDRLNEVSDVKATRIESFFDKHKRELISLSKDHHVVDFLSGSYTLESVNLLREHTLWALSNFIYKDTEEIFILDKEGNVVLATYEGRLNTNESNNPYFVEGKKDFYIKDTYRSKYFSNSLSISFSLPIFDNKGGFIGVLVKRIGIDDLNAVVRALEEESETGESYLVSKDGFMITESRFVSDVILKQKIDSPNFNLCQTEKHQHKKYLTFINYRGVSVLGSHSYIPTTNWCLLSEMSIDEVFQPQNNLLTMSIIIVILSLIITYLFSEKIREIIASPISRLIGGVKEVEKGNLDFKTSIGGGDEMGQLSRSFDQMISTLRKSREDIQKKVEEQTRDISEKSKYLEDQQRAILSVLEDVEDERLKTSQEKDKLNTILYSIADGVFVVDNNLNIIIFNDAASKISRISKEDAIGKKFDTVLKFVDEKTGKEEGGFVKRTIDTGEVQSIPPNTVLMIKSGENVAVADSSAPIKDDQGKLIGCIVVFRDVTESRKIEKMKSEFITIASHQLRTPLTGIQWVAERLMKVAKKFPKNERDYLSDIHFSSYRLSRLVDDLLNVSRIEEGRITIQPVEIDIISLFKKYFEEVKPLIDKKKIKFEFKKIPDKLIATTDRMAVQNIIQSLVSNAIEYTPKEGKVEVFIEADKNFFTFKVKDNGIGIPKKDQPFIFGKFSRGSNAQAVKTDGTGIGLYITKELVKLLKGDVGFKSEEGKGTEFFVKLPIKSEAISGSKTLVNKIG